MNTCAGHLCLCVHVTQTLGQCLIISGITAVLRPFRPRTVAPPSVSLRLYFMSRDRFSPNAEMNELVFLCVNAIFRSGRTNSCTVGYFPSVGRLGLVLGTEKERVIWVNRPTGKDREPVTQSDFVVLEVQCAKNLLKRTADRLSFASRSRIL